MVFHEELKDVEVKDIATKRPDLRKKVKSVEFAKQFGGGAEAIKGSLGCSKAEAEKFSKAYDEGFKGVTEFKKIGSYLVKNKGYVLICKYTGHKMYWENWHNWKEIDNTPEYEQRYLYSDHELNEYRKEGAKWERMALNAPTQG